jgi:hypothetical protein
MVVLSLICLVSGAGSAAASLAVRDRRTVLERLGGGLFAAGLCLVGAALPLYR